MKMKNETPYGLKKTLHGNIYQLKLLMLVINRAVQREYDFQMGSDVYSAACFDDLVLTHENKCRLVQIKHSTSPEVKNKNIKLNELMNASSRTDVYYLPKYFASFINIRQNQEYSGKDLDFILWTNRNIDSEAITELGMVEIRKPGDIFYLGDHNKQPKYYKIECKKGDLKRKIIDNALHVVKNTEGRSIKDGQEMLSDFLEAFTFAVNQPDELELENIIKSEIHILHNYPLYNVNVAYDAYHKVILDWLKEYSNKKFQYQDFEMFAKSLITTINKIGVGGINLAFTNTLASYNIEFINKKEIGEILSSDAKMLIIDTEGPTRLTCIRVWDAVKIKYKHKDIYSFIDCEMAQSTRELIIQTFLNSESSVLVVEGEAQDIPFISLTDKKIVIIQQKGVLNRSINFCEEPVRLTIKNEFEDLTEASQKSIIEKEVCFQGNNVKLSEIIDVETGKLIIDADTLWNLLTGRVIIGQPLKDGFVYKETWYINRTYVFGLLKQDICKSSKTEEFYMIGNDVRTLETINEKLAGRIRPLNNEKEFDDLPHRSDKNMHLLFVLDRDVCWKKTKGSVSKLEKHFYQKKQRSLRTPPNKMMLISDEAGMGKTTEIDRLSIETKKQFPHLIVFRIDLLNHSSFFSEYNLDEDKNYSKGILDLLKLRDNWSTFEKRYFDLCFNKRIQTLAIFFDGFDEICPEYKDIVIKLIKGLLSLNCAEYIVISTRPNMKTILENEFTTVSAKLQPLALKEQQIFLTKYWVSRIDISTTTANKSATELLTRLSKTLKDKTNKLFNNPLHIKMLAEIWEDRLKTGADIKLHKLDIHELYQKFVKMQFERYREQKDQKQKYAPRFYSGFNTFVDKHVALAKEIFTKGEAPVKNRDNYYDSIIFNQGGLVEIRHNTYQFKHRKYFDYFVSEEIIMRQFQGFDMSVIFSQKEHQVLRTFLDCKLGKSTPCHKLEFPLQLQQDIARTLCNEDKGNIMTLFLRNFSEDEKRKIFQNGRDHNNKNLLLFAVNKGAIAAMKALRKHCHIPAYELERGIFETLFNINLSAETVTDILNYLKEIGVNFNVRNEEGQTPLHVAVWRNNKNLVRTVLNYGVDVNAQDCNGNSPLMDAMAKNNAIQNMLLDSQPDVDLYNDKRETALHLRIHNSNKVKNIEKITTKLTINKQDNEGRTPVAIAVEKKHRKVLEELQKMEKQLFVTGATYKSYSSNVDVEHINCSAIENTNESNTKPPSRKRKQENPCRIDSKRFKKSVPNPDTNLQKMPRLHGNRVRKGSKQNRSLKILERQAALSLSHHAC